MLYRNFYRVCGEERDEDLLSHDGISEYSLCLDEQCEFAVKIGMPYELFWHGDIGAFDYYIKAYNKKIEEEAEKRDFSAHSVGFYVMQALRASYKLLNPFASKRDKDYDYPKTPITYKPHRTKEEIQRGEEVRKAIEEHNAKLEAKMKQIKEQGGDENG